MKIRSILGLAILAATLAPQASAQFTVIASEDFESYAAGTGLGSLNGGTGWFNEWWSGVGLADANVTTPGLNGSMNSATTVISDGGSYRIPSTMGFDDLIDNGLWGADDTTIWIRYRARRVMGGDDQYGGLSLNEQFVGEKLFLGVPYQADQWGYEVPGVTNESIVGTSNDQETYFVARIDYLPGDERLRIWIDPMVDNPTGPADLDVTIDDHRWNEIRLQSGQGALTFTPGYEFDDIVIETPAPDVYVDACNGDGGNQMGCTSCPCGNNAPIGTIGGCINQTGNSARLIAADSSSISAMDPMDLSFDMTGGNPMSLAVLTSGNSLAPQNSANPCFGLDSGVQSVVLDGLRCAVNGTQRHGGRQMDVNGDVGIMNNGWGGPNGPNPDIASQGGFVAGQTRWFQVFYRADDTLGCLTGQNTSQAVGVTFTP